MTEELNGVRGAVSRSSGVPANTTHQTADAEPPAETHQAKPEAGVDAQAHSTFLKEMFQKNNRMKMEISPNGCPHGGSEIQGYRMTAEIRAPSPSCFIHLHGQPCKENK